MRRAVFESTQNKHCIISTKQITSVHSRQQQCNVNSYFTGEFINYYEAFQNKTEILRHYMSSLKEDKFAMTPMKQTCMHVDFNAAVHMKGTRP